MVIVLWLVIGGVITILIRSLIDFIRGGKVQKRLRESGFSLELFYALLIIYCIVIVGFAVIYFLLSMEGIILVENGELRQVNALGSMIHSLYFSGVTILTIGYGDITPIGIGRFIALIEALVGYILPTAFVLRLVQNQERSRDQ
ncbi:potassium channel family protein [Virgibacillus sp. AGTR]|uniref:potassium channel family protein n=1 Tax=Virgibacillus TaxID=84406 RepID=UPI0019660155|nr:MULTISPECIES: potassium channel family protein [Virgibacillus]MCC2252068.1 potassium channel family protein [Virgibacillus sp. AGTR]QRZ19988.1 two pore domain potassium channel family protein [Virgibacillus sp. AGTR]WBX80341.1 potassium channel family protein [Virgibacillus salarius]